MVICIINFRYFFNTQHKGICFICGDVCRLLMDVGQFVHLHCYMFGGDDELLFYDKALVVELFP